MQLIPSLLPKSSNSASQSITRAAIDFGSGAIKIQVAQVNTQNKLVIGDPILATSHALNLTEDIASHDGYISETMEKKALAILSDLKSKAYAYSVCSNIEFMGIATAVFRKAKNGQTVLHRIAHDTGIPFQILPQEEEGALGFLTARSFHSHIPDSQLIAWDSGNGSFQVSRKDHEGKLQVYKGPLGHGTVRLLLSKSIRNTNSLSSEEATLLAKKIIDMLPPIPCILKDILQNPKTVVATFGDGESIFALVAQALSNLEGVKQRIQKRIIKVEEVHDIIKLCTDQTSHTFQQSEWHPKTLTSAIFLGTVMNFFKIKEIHYSRSIGITPGMLLSSTLWL